MNINRILRSLRRSWKTALAIGIAVGLLTTLASSLLQKPAYTATNVVLFQVADMNKVADPNEATLYATTLASSYVSMVNQPSMTVPVSEKLGLEQAELAVGISASAPRTNLVSTIRYEAPDAAQAEQVVRAFGDEMAQQVSAYTDKVDGKPRITVANQAVNVIETPGTAPSLISSLMKGAIAGLLALLAWLLVRALLDTRVHELADIDEVTDASVLANLNSADDGASLAPLVPFLGLQRPASLLLAAPRTAGAHAATVLAAARALDAREPAGVLLVDTDLRSGELSRLAGASGPGLSEVLSGQASLEQAVTRGDGLAVLGAGSLPPNPAELLASPALADTLARAASAHELVLISGSGLLEHSDTALVARLAQRSILLVGKGLDSQAQVRESLDLLETIDAPVAGVVLDAPSRKK